MFRPKKRFLRRASIAQQACSMSHEDSRRRKAEAKVAAQNSVRGTRYEDQFFKTKLCMFWEKGACTRGSDCKYAHGHKELNQMPNLTKTSLCKDLLTTGSCTRSDCLFAHSVEELRATNKFYKTSMCSFFRVGQCKLGTSCRHAHDPSELIDIPKPSRMEELESRTGGAARPGRRGRKSHDKHRTVQADDDDELGDMPSTMERIITSPATCGFNMVMMPRAVSQDISSSTSTATGGTATASQGSDDQDEDLDDVPDMWARMKTMPAGNVGAMVAGNRGVTGMSMLRNEVQAMPFSAAGQLMSNGMWRDNRVMPQDMHAGAQNSMMMVPCVLVPVPIQQSVPLMQKGPYMDAAACKDLRQMPHMSNEMEAKLLESAMPEVYED
ncbi:unnamed protein product [Effrenium voratum]|nr:unnamed protein product [Effrenium voratum]